MRWALRTFDSLAATVVAAVVGLAASQLQVFIHDYEQRLGGHLDEARLAHQRVVAHAAPPGLQDEQRWTRLAEVAAARVTALNEARRALSRANVFSRPFVFFSHLDGTIARSTLDGFRPALPLDAPSLGYALSGMFVGWLVYHAAKRAAAVAFRRRPRGLPT